MVAYTEARKRATKKYREKHKERTNYLNKRTIAKTFVTKYGTIADVKALQTMIDERLQQENE